MAQFLDDNQKTWQLKLDALNILDVRAHTCGVAGCKHRTSGQETPCQGIDLAAIDEAATKRLADPLAFIEVLWVLLSEQGEAQGVNYLAFAKAIRGDGAERAAEALLEAYAEFLPPDRRAVAKATARKEKAQSALAVQEVEAILTDPEFDRRAKTHLQTKLKALVDQHLTPSPSANITPASAASTPKA